MNAPLAHTTVLRQEAVDALVTTPDGLYVDGTYGRGGHARAVLARLSPRGRVVAFDRDLEAVAAARAEIDDTRFEIVHANFDQMREQLAARGIDRVHGVLLDLFEDEDAVSLDFNQQIPVNERQWHHVVLSWEATGEVQLVTDLVVIGKRQGYGVNRTLPD